MTHNTSPTHDAILAAPFGAIGIRCEGGLIRKIEFLPPTSAPLAARNTLAAQAARHITRFLCDPHYRLDLPLAPCGSVFAQRVWALLREIPPGHTRRYGELAQALGSAARAVGQACAANPYPLVIPCHRVVAAGGVGGFNHAREGFLLEAKKWLLNHERHAD